MNETNNIINVDGRLTDLKGAVVMGILNVTPDSFYADSRVQNADDIARRAEQIVAEGGTIIDVGACSTRPNSTPTDADEELRRLQFALPIIRKAAPNVPISIDTFRASVAEKCINHFGRMIINDVSGGKDADMFATVARLHVPYVLTSCENNLEEMLISAAEKIQRLRSMGAHDIIFDPGLGFGKTRDDNWNVLFGVEKLQILGVPLLIGASRKSMLWQTIGGTSATSLNATTVANTIALMGGASILRVHDVREAVEAVQIMALKGAKSTDEATENE